MPTQQQGGSGDGWVGGQAYATYGNTTRYECGTYVDNNGASADACATDVAGEDGTVTGRVNCVDILTLSDYTKEDDYIGGTDQNEVHIDTGTWDVAERVTVGVSTKCGSLAHDFNKKEHIFAWATMRSSASYSLQTKQTDVDHGQAEVSFSATKSYSAGENFVWIHGDQPQQTDAITSGTTSPFEFAFTGSLTAPHLETYVQTSCSVSLTVGHAGTSYLQNCFDTETATGSIVDGPSAGTCGASMVTKCDRTSDSNAEGTDIFDHAGLTDTRTWDVRFDSAIVQAVLVTNSRRIAQSGTSAKNLMDLQNEINANTDTNFNTVACNGAVNDGPCEPWQSNAVKAPPIYPAASKYACNGDCDTEDPFVVLSGFYNHKMIVTCPGTTAYGQTTTCHLTGGDDTTEDDTHVLTHGTVRLLEPPGNDPLFYVFGIADFGAATNEQITNDLNNGVNTNRRLRTAHSKDIKLGGGVITTMAPNRNSIRAN